MTSIVRYILLGQAMGAVITGATVNMARAGWDQRQRRRGGKLVGECIPLGQKSIGKGLSRYVQSA